MYQKVMLGLLPGMFKLSRLGPLVGVAVLVLLAGCGKHASVSDAANSAPRSGSSASGTGTDGQGAWSTASPRPEGTGPESPLPRSKGEVSVSVAALPIGPAGSRPTNNDQAECLNVSWLGTLRSPVTITVTGVVVVAGPFVPADPAAAGCTADDGRPCVGMTITAASDSTPCAAGLKWTGEPALNGGSVELAGTLSCHGLGPAACRQVLEKVKSDTRTNGPIGFDFPVNNTTSPPGGDTTSPPAGDTTSPPAGDTASPSDGDTASPPAGNPADTNSS